MKKRTSFLFVFTIVISIFSVTVSEAQEISQAEHLRREIRVLNLVNGLDLSPEQIRKIVECAEEIDRLKSSLQTAMQEWDRDMEDVLGEIRSQLEEKTEVREETAQAFHKNSNQAKIGRLKINEKIRASAKEIEDILEPHQLFQLEEYVPCIIPPKGELRIGQSRDYKGITKKLEQVRKIPDRAYRRRKGDIAQRAVLGVKLNNPRLVDLDEGEILKNVKSLYDRARQLSDTEFEIQKDALAEELVLVLKPGGKTGPVIQKIEKFLLSPEVVTILRNRMESD
ncbi:hypothetical protein ACFLT9_09345 [Acidobacteriota bacterium]